ncbi:MAG: SUF system NifU family Fe-S cluster assembly protein [Chloroflexaceae bacterium]|nr:SUF system NifU family Fe-S cluster assembly protein [Chloroflexaceae bacterium]
MQDFYCEHVLEHFKYPSNYGALDHPTVSHEEHNPLCGDRIRLDLLIENDIVKDIRFSGQGCVISQASASILTDEIKGKTVEAAKLFGKAELLEQIGIPLEKSPVRLKCALLSLKALKVCLYGVADILEEEWS